jgi:hypothetical protein
MTRSVLWVRAGGIVMLVIGASMVLASGGISDPLRLSLPDRSADVLLRAGFGTMLVGMFALFLFSEAGIPKGMALSMAGIQDQNNIRMLDSFNLKGRGVYMPPGGRLRSDRVFVPVEDRDLPLPSPSDGHVVNTGDLGPALGMFFVPPGKGAVDEVEALTGKRFGDDDPMDAQEAMLRITKGTGAIGGVLVRRQSGGIMLVIKHGPMKDLCSGSFDASDRLHGAIGCTGCSIPLTALARIEGAPLEIRSVSRSGGSVVYELRRLG